jgi:hypothetical protein
LSERTRLLFTSSLGLLMGPALARTDGERPEAFV